MRRRHAMIAIEIDEVRIADSSGEVVVPVGPGDCPYEAAEAAAAEYDGLATASLVISRPHAQLRHLADIPEVRGADLLDLVRAHRNRYFRHTHRALVIGAQWQEADEEGARVLAAAVPEEPLLSLESALAERSVRLVSVSVVDPKLGDVEVRTPALVASRKRERRVKLTAMVALALTGWIVAGGTYAVDLWRDHSFVTQELDALRTPLDRIAAIEAEVADFAPVSEALLSLSSPSSWLTPQVTALAQALPESAHLHALSVGVREDVLATVHASDPVAVVEALQAVWPGNVRVEGTLDDSVEGQLFTLRMEVEHVGT